MIPFQITCTTCNAPLTVRNSEAIGQILACPRCQSMVLVEAPPGHSLLEGPPPDDPRLAPDQEAGPGGPGPAQAGPAQAGPAQEGSDRVAPAASSRRPSSFSAADTVEGAYDSPKELVGELARSSTSSDSHPSLAPEMTAPEGAATEVTAPERAGEMKDGPPTASAADPLAPSSDWSSQEARQMRQWLLTGAAAVAGVVLAISLFGFLIARRQTQTPVAQSDPDPTEQADSNQAPSAKGGSANTDPADSGSPGEQEDERDSSEPPSNPDPAGGDVDQEVGAEGDEPPNSGPSPDTDSGQPGDIEASGDGGVSPLNPVIAEADSETPPFVAPGTVGEDAEENSSAALDLEGTLPTAESLRAFENLLGNDGAAGPVPPATGPATSAPLVEVPVTSSDVLQELPRPKPRNIHVARQLELPLVEIEFSQTPLRDFVYFVSDFSLIPISLDADALAAVPLDLGSPVSVKLTDTTVEELLEAVFTPHRLAVVSSETGVQVTFPPDIQKQVYDVQDLTAPSRQRENGQRKNGQDHAQQLEQIQQHLRELIAPMQWKTLGGPWEIRAEGGDRIEVSAPAAEQFRVLQVLERLRAARGLPLQSGLSPGTFEPGTRFSKMAETLNKKLRLNFVRERPLTEIVAEIGRQAGVQITIDWEATMHIGWNPDTEAQVAADDKPLSTVLNGLLHPMQLTYRVVDDSMLQISTPEALQEATELESYRVPEQLTGDVVVETVYGLFGKERFRAGGGQGAIRYDPTAHILLVSLPQSQQIALERLLRQWK